MEAMVLAAAVLGVFLVVVAAISLWAALKSRRRPMRHVGPSHDAVAADLESRLAEHAHKA